MANLLSWTITHGLALGIGFVAGAGGIKAAEAVLNRMTKGKWFPNAAAKAAK